MPYVALSLVKERLEGFVNTENSGQPRFGTEDKGIELTDSQIIEFQNQAEAEALRSLSKLYKIPLESANNGGKSLSNFEDMTRYSLQSLFLDGTVIRIMSYIFGQSGSNVVIRNFMENLRKQYNDNIEKSLKYDSSDGTIIPAYPDLVLSKLYIPRQNNPIPSLSDGSNISFVTTFSKLTKLD